jgi:hypothetical protein
MWERRRQLCFLALGPELWQEVEPWEVLCAMPSNKGRRSRKAICEGQQLMGGIIDEMIRPVHLRVNARDGE